jgi:diadenosine tetraphosphate (Ap4A) HIT family hydrolase
MANIPGAWMPIEQWNALVRGDGCPLCAEVESGEPANQHGYFVATLDASRLRLQMNQYVSGYCVLISTIHVREPYELPPAERARYFEDLMRAARALGQVFLPVKMNYQILGNAVPHLHCHLVPRYYGDPASGFPIDPEAGRVTLTPLVYEQRVRQIRKAL